MNITIISDTLCNHNASCTLTVARAFRNRGHEVNIVLPFYDRLYSDIEEKFGIAGSFYVKLPQGNFNINLYTCEKDNINFYFISNSRIFGREKTWGYHDDALRTAVYCTAAIETVIHSIDSTEYILTDSPNTALVPIFLKFKYHNKHIAKTIKTYHYINSCSYGIYDTAVVTSVFGLSPEDKHILICNGSVNLTRAAIICSSLVFVGENAIGILYDRSNDIHHTAIQFGFKIRKYRSGIDYNIFSPENDPDIHKTYSSESLYDKTSNKLFVQRYLYLQENEDIPLVILYADCNADTCRRYVHNLIQCDTQLIIISDKLNSKQLPSFSEKCICIRDSSAETLKNIFSAGDFCLFSGFGSECGNAAYISSCYGCVPITPTHRYFDFGFTYFNKLTLDGNAYTYEPDLQKDIKYTLWDALGVYKHDKKAYKKLQQNTMKKIFSATDSIITIEKEAEKTCYSFI